MAAGPRTGYVRTRTIATSAIAPRSYLTRIHRRERSCPLWYGSVGNRLSLVSTTSSWIDRGLFMLGSVALSVSKSKVAREGVSMDTSVHDTGICSPALAVLYAGMRKRELDHIIFVHFTQRKIPTMVKCEAPQ